MADSSQFIRVKIDLAGADTLLAALRELPNKAQNKVCKEATRVGAERLYSAVDSAVPVAVSASYEKNLKRRPGTLKNSVRIEQKKRKYLRRGQVGFVVLAGGQGWWGDAYYARLVEDGHGIGSAKKARVTKKQIGTPSDSRSRVPPHPFMRPAFDANYKGIASAMLRSIAVGIEREATKMLVDRPQDKLAEQAMRSRSRFDVGMKRLAGDVSTPAEAETFVDAL